MTRAVSPVVGVATLVGLTVLLSATLLGTTAVELDDPAPTATLSVSVDGGSDRIELVHRGGDELDVSEMDVHVAVDGEALRYQPPVPFFAARGFESGPAGAFNSASSDVLHTGERTSVAVASTNEPEIWSGATVTVRVTVGDAVVYDEEATAN